MKAVKIFKYAMIAILSIVFITILAVFIFFRTAPQIGGEAKGARLERMKQAPNYQDGKFQNVVETKMEMTWKTLRKTLGHYLFADKSDKNPKETIQVVPFNKAAFAADTSDVVFAWFGHSTILLKMQDVTLLIDPVIVGERASMFSFMGPERFDYSHHITLEELPDIDAVLLSHDHYDHLDYPTIQALKGKVKRFYLPLGVGAHFEAWGIPEEQIIELNWWDELDFRGLKLAFTPTRHFSGRGFGDRFKTLWGSWVIASGSRKLYFSGDSGYFPGFKEIGQKYGPFDLTFIECGAYNEGWSEIHMFPEQTAQAHLDLQGRLLMPIHWGKFDLSLHPWKESVNRLTQKAEEEGIELFTPEVGKMVTLQQQSELDDWWRKYQ